MPRFAVAPKGRAKRLKLSIISALWVLYYKIESIASFSQLLLSCHGKAFVNDISDIGKSKLVKAYAHTRREDCAIRVRWKDLFH